MRCSGWMARPGCSRTSAAPTGPSSGPGGARRGQTAADPVVRRAHRDDGQRLWCSVPARQAAPAQRSAPPQQPPFYPDGRQAPRGPGAGQAPGGYVPVAPGAGQLPAAGSGGSSIMRQPSAIMRLPTRVLRIGRAADNEVVVSDLSVSRYHAELRRSPRGYEIVDLNSHNGTYVNGQRVTSAPVTQADLLG